VLGRAGFLKDFSFCLDDEYLTLTRQGPWQHWWRRRWSILWFIFGLRRATNEPL